MGVKAQQTINLNSVEDINEAATTAGTKADAAQTAADAAQTTADTAKVTAVQAQGTADGAKSLAEKTSQHFWTGDEGAHITTTAQGEAISGGNTLITGEGLEVRDGDTTLASFKKGGAIIGKKSGANIEVDSDSVSFMDSSTRMGYISDSRLQINAGDFKKIAVGKYVLRVDSDGTFILGM